MHLSKSRPTRSIGTSSWGRRARLLVDDRSRDYLQAASLRPLNLGSPTILGPLALPTLSLGEWNLTVLTFRRSNATVHRKLPGTSGTRSVPVPVRVEGNIRRKRGHGINHRKELQCFLLNTSHCCCWFAVLSAIAMAPSEITTEPDVRRKGPRIEEAISNPGAVKINVKGAFIVDDEPRSRSPVEAEGVHYENKDIRLPHHTGVVSHVAVDVSYIASGPFFFPSSPLVAPHCRPSPQSRRWRGN